MYVYKHMLDITVFDYLYIYIYIINIKMSGGCLPYDKTILV